jgi:(1->4)-alpha-D-glucan 1-alpha-D-glucosylmutase
LLERQHYRLAWWRSAGDAINWRRFFDINGLAALRIEDEEVFETVHRLLFRLYEQGLIDGVRVDHVDGLTDPPHYCRRLRERLNALAPRRPPDAPPGPAWFVVEKILGAGEHLPRDWDVDGTSGYDFMDEVCALLHDPAGELPLRALWTRVSGRTGDFDAEEAEARRNVLDRSFTGQLDAMIDALHHIARSHIETRDTTRATIRRTLVATLAHFPVYRDYGFSHASDALTRAVLRARRDVPAADHATLELLERWLGATSPPDVAVRFQQLCAPLAAKAVEDTAFYRYGVLLSRNEVGADMHRFSIPVSEFHAGSLQRLAYVPHGMLATATHDHKRGEDTRARLAVLSEIPEEWDARVTRWFALNAPYRKMADGALPSPGDEAMLYQMVVAAWPIGLKPEDAEGVAAYTERLAGWQLKALREAKLATDWIAPDEEYEAAARSFLDAIMADGKGFLAEAAEFARRIGPAGALNGLAQTLLKLTVPGVPDFYQGAEFWDLSMVDPDNRRPVDFASRIEALEADRSPTDLIECWDDGRLKQAVIRRALRLRGELPELFARGSYQPLEVTGGLAGHVVAFVRAYGDTRCVVVLPRLVARLLDSGIQLGAVWQDTSLQLTEELMSRRFRDRISDACIGPVALQVTVDTLLARFPAALLVSES